MLAVIETGGKQYTVEEGSVVDVELLDVGNGVSHTFSNVLFISDDGKVMIGKPTVEGASVDAEIIGSVKADRVLVFKRKPRKDYRKRIGHRQRYTKIKITKITGM